MRDWLTENDYTFTIDQTPTNYQLFKVHKNESKMIRTWSLNPDIEIMVSCPCCICARHKDYTYVTRTILDSRDPECFPKLKRVLNES
jgi:hypothetical protein